MTKQTNLQKSDASIGIGFIVAIICIIGGLVSAFIFQSLWFIVYGMVSGSFVFLVLAIVSMVYYCSAPHTHMCNKEICNYKELCWNRTEIDEV